jgi:hypothetical protein
MAVLDVGLLEWRVDPIDVSPFYLIDAILDIGIWLTFYKS